ncbi:hypothetical protein [Bacillus sp. B-jedd]|uniref:hypothetical protein n=1 Tax=Bacillus sp. B-jedd TaxID=1476857 RepID=UPI0005156919|nr:hypothetical protein [Bacillus sp. B-jedd]CEG26126.1 hypothetical protein BN1002_00967 [Bacillus sp. B-jedd]
MDKQKIAPKPMLYIVQPDFPSGSLQMQDHFIWRKRTDQKGKGDSHDVNLHGGTEEAVQAALETEAPSLVEQAVEEEIVAVELEHVPQTAVNEIAQAKEGFVEVKVNAGTPMDGVGLSETAPVQPLETPIEVKEINELVSEKTAEAETPIEKKKAQTALVQYFLQKMKEKNIKHVDTLATAVEEDGDHAVMTEQMAPIINETANMVGGAAANSSGKNKADSANSEPAVSDEAARKIWRTVTRLARYPHFLERPSVKAIVDGKPMTFQVESKRGERIRIKTENKLKIIKIEDISDIQIQF